MLKLLAMKGTGKLAALPLSYINCFFTEATRTSRQKEQSVDTMTAPEQQVKKKRFTPPKLAIPSLDHSDSLEGGEDDGNFSDSDDSWASDYATGAIQLEEKPEIPWLLHIAQVNQSL